MNLVEKFGMRAANLETRRALTQVIGVAMESGLSELETLGNAQIIAINLAEIEKTAGNWNARRAYRNAADILARDTGEFFS